MNPTAAFAALADPTRRAIFEALVRGPAPVGQLTEGLEVSRPAVSQHLKILSDCGLARHEKHGTRHIYEATPEGLHGLRAYIDFLDGLWSEGLDRFKTLAEATSPVKDPS